MLLSVAEKKKAVKCEVVVKVEVSVCLSGKGSALYGYRDRRAGLQINRLLRNVYVFNVCAYCNVDWLDHMYTR